MQPIDLTPICGICGLRLFAETTPVDQLSKKTDANICQNSYCIAASGLRAGFYFR